MRRVLQALAVLAVGLGLGQASRISVLAAEPQAAPQDTKAIDPGVLFDKLDTGHTGVLTVDKIPAENRGLFERLLRLAGKPADGQLTRAEFVAQLKSITEPPAKVEGPASTSGAGGSTSKPAAAPAANSDKKNSDKKNSDKNNSGKNKNGKKQPNPAKVFARWDKNHTGKLTLSDIPEKRQKLFKRLLKLAGKRKDGSLTKDEFVQAFDTVLAKRLAAKNSSK